MPNAMPQRKRIAGGGSAPVTAGAAATSTPAPAAAPTQASPGYVNFSRLLAVNQGGAQRMANNLAGKVQQQGQQAQGAIQGAQQGFQGQVQAGTLQHQEVARPSNTANSQSLYAQAGALAENAKKGYSGPKDWKAAGYDTTALSSQAKGAQDAAHNLTTAGGRGALLREGVQGPYSAGMSTLDAALSGAALGSRGRDLSALYGGLSQQLVDAQRQGDTLVGKATEDSAAAAAQYGQDADLIRGLGDRALASEQSGVTLPTPPAPSPAPSTRPPGNMLGNTYVPVAPPQSGPVTIGTTTINPPPPSPKGGRYIGGTWVPYT